MSIRPMYNRCRSCGRTYSFNPSVGHLGLVCPYCGRKPYPTESLPIGGAPDFSGGFRDPEPIPVSRTRGK